MRQSVVGRILDGSNLSVDVNCSAILHIWSNYMETPLFPNSSIAVEKSASVFCEFSMRGLDTP
jgi:hypothetical protein